MNASPPSATLFSAATWDFAQTKATLPLQALAITAPPRRLDGRSLSPRLAAAVSVVLLQVGFFTALHMGSFVTIRQTPEPLMVIDIPPETASQPEVRRPRAPVLTAPQVVTMDLPEVQIAPPSPTAITAVAAPHVDPKPVAPTNGVARDGTAAIASYQTVLLGHLARHKHYPATARSRRQQGVAMVHFTMDRNGAVLSAALSKPSGVAILDEESVDLLRRASPLPAPPPEVAGNPVAMIVPVEFFLR